MTNLDRYARQMRVPGFDRQAQQALRQASVVIIGAGGLGGPIAASLAGAGVGHITIADHDNIELSNLHRQWLFVENDIGTNKASALQRHIARLNSSIAVEAVEHRVSLSNVATLTKDASLVIDAADNFPTSLLLSDACLQQGQAYLTGSVNQLYGYTGLLCAGGPSLRAIFPRIPLQQTSCDVVGVTGPAVSVLAGLQAQIALSLLANISSPVGQMHYVDLRDFSLRSIDCSSAKEPSNSSIKLISSASVTSQDWVIDVRERDEAKAAPQNFSVHQNLPISDFDPNQLQQQNQRLLFACRSGQRALIAAQQAVDHGVDKVAVVIPDNE